MTTGYEYYHSNDGEVEKHLFKSKEKAKTYFDKVVAEWEAISNILFCEVIPYSTALIRYEDNRMDKALHLRMFEEEIFFEED